FGLLPTSAACPRVVISLAGLVLFPLLDELVTRGRAGWVPGRWVRMPAGILMTCGLLLPARVWATVFVGPWVALLFAVAMRACVNRPVDWSAAWLSRIAGLVFPGVGGLWLVQATLGLRPLGFSDEVVILTAMHFHFAGAVLPIVFSEAAGRRPGRLADAACLGVITGIPLVAAGITATQVRGPAWIEGAAAVWMAAAGIAAAAVMAVASASPARPVATGLRLVSSASLGTGMLFAAAYGLRGPLGLEGLTIPVMQASHGVLMAVGFATCGVLGEWVAVERR
ncbi:MAG TPA: YndJ family transporter, partial [Caulifigura sp.]|nr:YndJ family transporter [Caulifigura sp.]